MPEKHVSIMLRGHLDVATEVMVSQGPSSVFQGDLTQHASSTKGLAGHQAETSRNNRLLSCLKPLWKVVMIEGTIDLTSQMRPSLAIELWGREKVASWMWARRRGEGSTKTAQSRFDVQISQASRERRKGRL
jgi:hypothetical protein